MSKNRTKTRRQTMKKRHRRNVKMSWLRAWHEWAKRKTKNNKTSFAPNIFHSIKSQFNWSKLPLCEHLRFISCWLIFYRKNVVRCYRRCSSKLQFNWLVNFSKMLHAISKNGQAKSRKKNETVKRTNEFSYIIDCTYGIIVEHNFAIFFANRSWLQFTSCCLIIWFWCWRHVFDVVNSIVEHLQ